MFSYCTHSNVTPTDTWPCYGKYIIGTSKALCLVTNRTKCKTKNRNTGKTKQQQTTGCQHFIGSLFYNQSDLLVLKCVRYSM